MKKRFCSVLLAAVGAAYGQRPVRSIAPNAIVSVKNFTDGSIQFFLVGDLTRLQGDTVETVSSGGTTVATNSIPEPTGPTTRVLAAEVPNAMTLGAVAINVISPTGTVVMSFSANTSLIM